MSHCYRQHRQYDIHQNIQPHLFLRVYQHGIFRNNGTNVDIPKVVDIPRILQSVAIDHILPVYLRPRPRLFLFRLPPFAATENGLLFDAGCVDSAPRVSTDASAATGAATVGGGAATGAATGGGG
jgi:hypothetical protein